MVVEAETGSDEHAKYKANAHACRRLWAFAKNNQFSRLPKNYESFNLDFII
jgi:hypothetical protein